MEFISNNWIEFIATITGILGVWLTTRQNILCWPIGIISVTLSMIVFFQSKLYYDTVLQVFYFILGVYGWHNWYYKKDSNNKLKVTTLKKTQLFYYILIAIVLVLIFGYLSQTYTDSSLPYWDAFTTTGGIIATVWMARKVIDNWLAWILINTANVGIYFYKDLYFFTFLYFVYIVLALVGYLSWKKDFTSANISK